ncbi:SAM-dependent methyltransferase [Streptomyces sp. NBC_01795]|uniref:SAM-dependent methyltransferase n=1 Tax=unclassified Streptomyces TaxID=2593676 RepID=UPI002DD8532B|nr:MULTISPECIES: SAM-dependent methyltransferase [unclassified Streptomyces]WSA90461.1 SAM-dependent methyltransferase [Streptomyces sp. NBC_01795]WSB74687.1 SAM-dependent methyltransferase [Streptomyces sp. NBC_01775]
MGDDETNETEKSVSEAGFTPEQIDTTTPHPARMYDYYLGGRDNYEADRDAAGRVLSALPDIGITARSNRDFMHRAVRTAVGAGVRQIIDIGTGIPTSPNTHEVAREVHPDVRVAYVDNDPIVATYAAAKLTNSGNAGMVLADIRDPKVILDHPVTQDLIDFDEPVALMLLAVLHFITDAEDAEGIVRTLTERLPAGSHLILSHATDDFNSNKGFDHVAKVYNEESTASAQWRSGDEVRRFFEGFELLEPGLVQLPLWRPDGPVPAGKELTYHMGYGGVGVK